VQKEVLEKILPHMNVSSEDTFFQNAYVHIDDHLSVSIGGYVVSQLHVPGFSAKHVSSYASGLLSSARLVSDDVVAAGFANVRAHSDGVYEF
jgi:hypothetical protein